MSNALPKRVLLLQQRQWGRGIGHELAKRFQRDGSRLAALTFKKSTDAFTRRQIDVTYDFIESHDAIVDVAAYSNTSLEQICTALGVESIWPMVMSRRNFVYNYGEKYYYSFRKNLSDEAMVAYVKNLYDRLTWLFDEFKPELIVAPNFVAMAQTVAGLLAKQRGVKVVSFTDSKVHGVEVTGSTPYLDEGPFIDRVRELNLGADSPNRQRARQYVDRFRESFIHSNYVTDEDAEEASHLIRLKREIYPFWKIVRFLMGEGRENYIPSLGVTIDYRPPRIILRDHYTAKRYRRAALARPYTDLDRLDEFVYFPLQVQPEAQIDMLAPYFANQIETSRQVAMSLPGDYTLAVKDHPGMISARSTSYLEKVARLPNVKLLDPRAPTSDILNRCSLVISPGGTTLAEAAFLKKPAIQLGWLGTTLMLPNVTQHTDMTTLSGAILRALARDDLHTEEYEQRLQNYVAAAYDTGLEMDIGRVWYKGGRNEDYDAIYRKVREALEGSPERVQSEARLAPA